MSANITLARPYAKAVFEYANDNSSLLPWTDVLHALAVIISKEEVKLFLTNPSVRVDKQIEFVTSVVLEVVGHTLSSPIHEFISVLAHNKRIPLLPWISTQFDALRDEQEKTMVVDVLSFELLNKEQESKLITALNRRLNKRITLNTHINKSLLGGAILRAGDLVIDGSVRGKLNQLTSHLT